MSMEVLTKVRDPLDQAVTLRKVLGDDVMVYNPSPLSDLMKNKKQVEVAWKLMENIHLAKYQVHINNLSPYRFLFDDQNAASLVNGLFSKEYSQSINRLVSHPLIV